MDLKTRKSVIRKLRGMLVRWPPASVDEAYDVGRLAACLLPDWLESEHRTFDEFLYEHGWRSNVAERAAWLAHNYYEVPSRGIWRQLDFYQITRAAQLTQVDCRERLLACGINVLDLMAMI